MTELWEEMSRLRSIRESEEETDCWNHTLPSLGQAQQAGRTMVQSIFYPLSIWQNTVKCPYFKGALVQ